MSNALETRFNLFAEDPYPFYTSLRHEEPVSFCPELDAWLVTDYQDIQNILTKHEKFSSQNSLAFPIETYTPRMLKEIAKGYIPTPSVINTDRPEHTRLRMPLAKALTPGRIKGLEPLARTVANRLVDAFIHQQHAEIISQFAYLLAYEVFLTLLGIPQQDLELTKKWVHDWLTLGSIQLDEEHQLACVESVLVFQQYLVALITERRNMPQDDLISALVHFNAPSVEPFTEQELVRALQSLIFAGIITTTNMIGTGVQLLLAHPEHWQTLCDHPDSIPHAVEEILRFDGPNRLVARVTTQEVTVGGVALPECTSLQLVLGAGNRDEAHFAHADKFHIQRTPNHHLTFGHGIHFCPGATLARLEGRIAFETLTQRIPQLRLVPGQTLTHKPTPMFRGYEQIEVEW